MASLISTLHEEPLPVCCSHMRGRVTEVRGPIIYVSLPRAAIGDTCSIRRRDGQTVSGQVVAFAEHRIAVTPFDSHNGIAPGDLVETTGTPEEVCFSPELVGRVLNAYGTPIDSGEPLHHTFPIPLHRPPPHPLSRSEISQQLITGVRAVDALTPVGYGQRLGLFAGAGVGKSTLLSMLTSHADVDVVVIGLIGERGREVGEFVSHLRATGGINRAVLVVSTSDEAPLRRMRAPLTATTIAEQFRDQGKRVLLLLDSLTRMARAMRDVGLAAGEMPVRQGYPSSVFTELPRLLERAGTSERGSITAIYTVLKEANDASDVLSEEIKSILDGHILMREEIASRGIRPAIDFTRSISRLAERIHTPELRMTARSCIQALHRLQNDRDLVLLGGHPDPELAAAMELEENLAQFLTQQPGRRIAWAETQRESREIAAKLIERRKHFATTPR